MANTAKITHMFEEFLNSEVVGIATAWDLSYFGKQKGSNSDPLRNLDETCYQNNSALLRLHFKAELAMPH